MTILRFPLNQLTAQNIRIGLCSDTHYWPGGESHTTGSGRVQHQDESRRIQQQLLSELDTAGLDMVFHLGDITCGGGSFHMPTFDFFRTLEQTYREFDALPMPVFALPGNHDCPPGGDWSYCERLWGLNNGTGGTIDTPSARLVLLNAQGHSAEQRRLADPGDPIHGWVHDAELARLDHALATAERPVLLFVHQLLQPWSTQREEWADFYGVRNAAAVMEILARHGNVRAVFQGHAHMYDVQSIYVGAMPCTFIVLPAIIEYPMAWLSLTLSPGVLRVQCHPLRLNDLTRADRRSPHAWRRGRDAWQDFTIALA